MSEYEVAQWAIKQCNTITDKPLFMSIGYYHSHSPLLVPKPYLDEFPLSFIRRPSKPSEGDDWDDLPIFA